MTGARALGVIGILAGLVACASPPPPNLPSPGPGARVHVVRRGENLWRISQRYGTTVDAIARANRIEDPTQIRAGIRIWVPRGVAARPRSNGREWEARDSRGRTGRTKFIWPIRGKMTSGFGLRRLSHHDGIDISASKGTKVRAAEAGRVVHSDRRLSGYGNLVIVKHAGSLATVYAHNRKNLVSVGEFVEKGQVIAEVGNTGRASASHLHFEVRRDGSARNPLDYLP